LIVTIGLLTESNYPKWHATAGNPEFDALRAATREVVEMCRAAGTRIERLGMAHSLTNPYSCSTLVAIKDRAQLLENLGAIQKRIHLLDDNHPLDLHHDQVANPEKQLGTSSLSTKRVSLSAEEKEEQRMSRELLAKAKAIYAKVPKRTWATGIPTLRLGYYSIVTHLLLCIQ
jgi:hypothetical protein